MYDHDKKRRKTKLDDNDGWTFFIILKFQLYSGFQIAFLI